MKPISFEATSGRKSIREIIDEGRIAVQYCRGQTTLYIPSRYAESLGPSRILRVIEGVFDAKRLDKFRGYAINQLRDGVLNVKVLPYDSYEIEIPPVIKEMKFGKPLEWDPDNKIPKLIQLINQELAKL